jgi:predicted RNA-binding protein associated with RNAse of E/G family
MAEAFAMLDDQALVNSLGYNMVEAESDSKEFNIVRGRNAFGTMPQLYMQKI